MRPPRVSVVVISWERPDDLYLCLTALGQQTYDPFEIVVIADPQGLARVMQHPLAEQIKFGENQEPNVSAARNAGIALAAGDIVAFIDDDAVAEPSWLANLVKPFSDETVSACGGFVIGRNGISLQWSGRLLDSAGFHHDLAVSGPEWSVSAPPVGMAIKTEGTNCAVRRDVLADLGGFDPAFRFYHDEADLNLRLARAGYHTALAPRALVHHRFVRSRRRTSERAPTDLFEIGASTSVLLRKHCDPDLHARVLKDRRAEERARLLRHMISGTCEPRDVTVRLAEFEAGLRDGKDRVLGTYADLGSGSDFRPVNAASKWSGHKVIAGRIWRRKLLCAQAEAAVISGSRATVFCFSPTALFHRVRFDERGFWIQTGGVFGRSKRTGSIFRLISQNARVALETARLAEIRN